MNSKMRGPQYPHYQRQGHFLVVSLAETVAARTCWAGAAVVMMAASLLWRRIWFLRKVKRCGEQAASAARPGGEAGKDGLTFLLSTVHDFSRRKRECDAQLQQRPEGNDG